MGKQMGIGSRKKKIHNEKISPEKRFFKKHKILDAIHLREVGPCNFNSLNLGTILGYYDIRKKQNSFAVIVDKDLDQDNLIVMDETKFSHNGEPLYRLMQFNSNKTKGSLNRKYFVLGYKGVTDSDYDFYVELAKNLPNKLQN
ncbi:MAG: hypothetical protein KC516_01450 [Nanoarchaeota archaeon]|nr:hypothetical protein [Nanoarchaeota archaeon]